MSDSKAVHDKLAAILFSENGLALCDHCLSGKAGVTVYEAAEGTARLATLPSFVRERAQCSTCRGMTAVTRAVPVVTTPKP